MGYMLGTCILHSFVVEDEKDGYRIRLENSLAREREQKTQISESREALSEALGAAEEANKAKTAFLSNMSHEIRTPMNAIVGYTDFAKRSDDLVQMREYLEKIDSSSKYMLALLNDVLEMSRIESGKLELSELNPSLSRKFIPTRPDAAHRTDARTSPSVLERLSISMGLATCASMPASRDAFTSSRKAFADMATIGVRASSASSSLRMDRASS